MAENKIWASSDNNETPANYIVAETAEQAEEYANGNEVWDYTEEFMARFFGMGFSYLRVLPAGILVRKMVTHTNSPPTYTWHVESS